MEEYSLAFLFYSQNISCLNIIYYLFIKVKNISKINIT